MCSFGGVCERMRDAIQRDVGFDSKERGVDGRARDTRASATTIGGGGEKKKVRVCEPWAQSTHAIFFCDHVKGIKKIKIKSARGCVCALLCVSFVSVDVVSTRT